MMTFGVWRWNYANGGMRFAFPLRLILLVSRFLPGIAKG
jgi:hypothetical protein